MPSDCLILLFLKRKISSDHWKRQTKQMQKLMCQLISSNKPYIKVCMLFLICKVSQYANIHTSNTKICNYQDGMQYARYEDNVLVQKLLEDNSEEWSTLAGYNRTSTLEVIIYYKSTLMQTIS